MDMQRLLFKNLKDIKDYWVKASVKGLNPNNEII
jgi:hypothetical protein